MLLTHLCAITRILQIVVLLVLAHFSYKLCRISSPILDVTRLKSEYLTARNRLALLDHRTRTKTSVRLHVSSFKNATTRPNTTVVINTASAKNGSIPNNHIIANRHKTRKTTVRRLDSVHNSSVLNVALRSNSHRVVITSDNRTIPHSRSSRNLNVADYRGVRGNIGSGIDYWSFPIHRENRPVARVYAFARTKWIPTCLRKVLSSCSLRGATFYTLFRFTQNSASLLVM